jgi:hypothetical protein
MTAAKLKASNAYWRNRLARATRGMTRHPAKSKAYRDWANIKKHAQSVLARNAAGTKTVQERAYEQASKLVGLMEHGGNNMGTGVTKIIRAAGGTGPEPWCGDTMFYVYRLAGSKAITKAVGRLMAYVPYISRVKGLQVISKSNWRKVKRGDLIRFEFNGDHVDDHTAMFSRWIVPGVTAETIEGNTGPSGAVSDSTTGGDGVYRKQRNIGLIADFVHVSR